MFFGQKTGKAGSVESFRAAIRIHVQWVAPENTKDVRSIEQRVDVLSPARLPVTAGRAGCIYFFLIRDRYYQRLYYINN